MKKGPFWAAHRGSDRITQLCAHVAEPSWSFLLWLCQKFCKFISSFAPQVAQFSEGWPQRQWWSQDPPGDGEKMKRDRLKSLSFSVLVSKSSQGVLLVFPSERISALLLVLARELISVC